MQRLNKIKQNAKDLRCRQTEAEKCLWMRLRDRQVQGIKFRRQQPIDHFIVDFVSFEKRLVIEVDGGQHNKSIKSINDGNRTAYLKEKGFRVLRCWNNDV